MEKQEQRDKLFLDYIHLLDRVLRISRDAVNASVPFEEIDVLMRVQKNLYNLIYKTSNLYGGEKK